MHMDRNDASTDGMSGSSNDFGTTPNSGGNTGSLGYGSSAGRSDANSTSGTTGASSYQDQEGAGLADRARDIAGSAQDRLADVGSTVRDRAGSMKDSLANALDSGADKLRNRASGSSDGQLAGATSAGDVAMSDGRMAQVSDKVAGGMHSAASWLRDADLDGLKSGVERQAREHPGRTLLVAVGIGYLIGKAFRD
jgi:hypothetical protein